MAVGAAAGSIPVRAASAAASPGPAGGARRRRVDVAIVGAGLAGLTAARELVKAGRSVLVVEAQRRVGGRVLNQPLEDGHVTEAGGSFIGPTQDRLAALARELGVATFKTYNEGNNLYYRQGSLTPYSTSGPLGPVPPDPTGAVDAEQALVKLDQMALSVPVDAPWNAPRAGDWDGQSVETWTNANLATESGRFLLGVAAEPLFGTDLSEPSLLHLLWYIHAAGNETTPGTLERLVNTADGAQDSHFAGGSGLIPERMARQLGARRVVLESPVRRIVRSGRQVHIVSDRVRVTAKRAIVAVPPTVAARIEYRPAMPPWRDQFTQRMSQGALIKVAAVYDRPFWREQGLSGQVVSDVGPGRTTFDVSPADGSIGIMLAFVGADDARAWLRRPQKELFDAVVRNLGIYFGAQALEPKGSAVMNWTLDPWVRGGPTGSTPPGLLTNYGPALIEPVGRLHWAGTETATYWRGYMDGAVRSGERAAKEVLAAL